MNASCMQIPGGIDPVPVPRDQPPRADGRVDLLGLTRDQLRDVLADAGLEAEAGQAARQAAVALDLQSRHDRFHADDRHRQSHAPVAGRALRRRPAARWSRRRFRPTARASGCCARTTGRNMRWCSSPMPIAARLCVSSQVGCTLNCRFCHTGTMKLVRNLTAGEIVGQVMLARDALGEWPSQPEGRMLTNIVMMGMGEPLYNFDNVRDALKLVMDGDGLALSKRRITLSTSGVVPMMARAGEEIGVNLAVSLHAVTKEVRDEIVPINRKYGIDELLQACADYPGANNARRITFEYVMLQDKNDSDEDARELVRLIRKYELPAKVNLIPFNPWPGVAYECSTPERIARVQRHHLQGAASRRRCARRAGATSWRRAGSSRSASEKISRAELDRRAEEKQAALGWRRNAGRAGTGVTRGCAGSARGDEERAGGRRDVRARWVAAPSPRCRR